MEFTKLTKYYATLPNGKTISAESVEKLEEKYKKETESEEQEITIKLKFPIRVDYVNPDVIDAEKALLKKITGKNISYRVVYDSKTNRHVKFWIGKVEPTT